MRKNKKSLGFTMAELLVVVAIVIILAGVAFIAVQRYQRSMAQLERNTIAKEIFIAAQNHLTMADSQGYLTKSPDGDYFGKNTGETGANGKSTNIYYVIGPSSGNILDQMLPFGSIDETVRSGGSYLIHYQTNPALVLDVFYCTTSGSPAKFNKDGGIKDSDYSELMANRKDKPDTTYVLGWYGSEEALANGDIILAPTVEVVNAERLTVQVTDTNSGNANAALKLIITGETSGAKLAIKLSEASQSNSVRFYKKNGDTFITVVLDDITTASANSTYDTGVQDGLHFADLNKYAARPDTGTEKILQFMKEGDTESIFLPGENITVEAVAYSNTTLTNIAYSSSRTTNSLFADPGEVPTTAMIANCRHLENLDAAVSGLSDSIQIIKAEQIDDLVWHEETPAQDSKAFTYLISKTKLSDATVNVYKQNATTGTQDDCYFPASPTVALTYEGNSHTITGVKVDNTGETPDPDMTNAGLFGALGSTSNACTIQNLELIDFSVKTSSGNAGALAGSLTNTTVTNVLARNTAAFETALTQKEDADSKARITVSTASGSAGGLIGSATNSTVGKSAAALIVKSTVGSAGGLIGTTSGGSVTACYSGGHTKDKKNGNTVIGVDYDATNYNVTGTTSVGGLIGDAGSTEIKYSYSTCSATGATVGGLIGEGNGTVSGCYCTGLVSGTTAGAFAGSLDSTPSGCKYFEIINEQLTNTEYPYLPALGNAPTDTSVGKIDEDADSYNTFTGAPSTWKKACAYLPTLATYYADANAGTRTDAPNPCLFNLRTVKQLGGTINETPTTADGVTTPADFVVTHYGDWPAPEIFVLNN